MHSYSPLEVCWQLCIVYENASIYQALISLFRFFRFPDLLTPNPTYIYYIQGIINFHSSLVLATRIVSTLTDKNTRCWLFQSVPPYNITCGHYWAPWILKSQTQGWCRYGRRTPVMEWCLQSGTCFFFDTKMTICLWQSLTAVFAAGLHHLWPMGMIIFQWRPFGTKRNVEILSLCCAFMSLSQIAGSDCWRDLQPACGQCWVRNPTEMMGDLWIQTCSWLDIALMPEEHLKVSPGAANLPRCPETLQEFCSAFL